jgi:hypothetical protein
MTALSSIPNLLVAIYLVFLQSTREGSNVTRRSLKGSPVFIFIYSLFFSEVDDVINDRIDGNERKQWSHGLGK